jgi:hypothetical protein
MSRRIGLALAFALWPALASAYESQCRDPDWRGGADLESSMEHSVCVLPDAPRSTYGTKECAEGLDAARGRQLGEHSYITLQAMKLAGLPRFMWAEMNDPNNPVLEYYTAGTYVPGTNTPSLEPTGPGAMLKKVRRATTIPEFANVPDVSYGMTDFVLGNEHCAAYPGPSDVASLNVCHAFASHMGLVNSNHWPPQARAMYDLYHGIAMDTAKRCRGIREAFPSTGATIHPLRSWVSGSAAACDLEALAFESVGSHFIEDVWSTGHMWDAWGSPDIADMRRPDEFDPLVGFRALAVAGIRGMVHGIRHLARGYTGLLTLPITQSQPLAVIQHDQLCLPGPTAIASGGDYALSVEFMSGARGPYAGGGDLYLLPCTTRSPQDTDDSHGDPARAVLAGGAMRFQRARLLSCVARGFEAVFDETLPPKDRHRTRPATEVAKLELDKLLRESGETDVTSSRDPACWDPLVTNEAMALGFGVSAVPGLRDPAIVARIVLNPITTSAIAIVSSSPEGRFVARVSDRLRDDLVVYSSRLAARRKESRLGTTVAQPQTPAAAPQDCLNSLLGICPNSQYASKIRNGEVDYLERADVQTWRPLGDEPCANDGKCIQGGFANRGRYCGRTGPGISDFKCFQKEAALLNAFRRAELPKWCESDTAQSLNLAAAICTAGKDPKSDACEACIQVVLPHRRDACDEVDYQKLAGGFDKQGKDHRSICDVLVAAGVAPSFSTPGVYIPQGKATSIPEAVRRYCTGESAGDPPCTSGGDLVFTDESSVSASKGGTCCETGYDYGPRCGSGGRTLDSFQPAPAPVVRKPMPTANQEQAYPGPWPGKTAYTAGAVEGSVAFATSGKVDHYTVKIHVKAEPSVPLAASLLTESFCTGTTHVPDYSAISRIRSSLQIDFPLDLPVGSTVDFSATGALDAMKDTTCVTGAQLGAVLAGPLSTPLTCIKYATAASGRLPVSCKDTATAQFAFTTKVQVSLDTGTTTASTSVKKGTTTACSVKSDSAVTVDIKVTRP